MSQIAIKVENVSKLYRLGDIGTGTISHDINRWWAKVRGKEDPFAKIATTNDRSQKGNSEFVWSLKDINFEINKGDAVGIIGRNGAGKSTLLKILSRVTGPTTGNIKINGRIASLLEVGTGFNPELSGRENIYMNGAILGMSRSEITSKLDEIIDFSGCDAYIDTPVKRYSSGMYVRLAFAVAAHLEPEILIVDEVLAVGDAEFQRKCLGKMQEVNSNDGRTVLFVSHNMQAISTLTTKSIYMSKGQLSGFDETAKIIKQYLNDGLNNELEYYNEQEKDRTFIKSIKLITTEPNNVQKNGEEFVIEIVVHCIDELKNAGISVEIQNINQVKTTHVWNFDSEVPMCRTSGLTKLTCRIPKLRLYMDKYFLNVYFAESYGRNMLDKIENVCPFEVVMHGKKRDFEWREGISTYIEEFEWRIN